MSIALVTFDIFGTVIDWRRGLSEAVDRDLSDPEFDRIVDRQGELERERFLPYAGIVARSLVDVLALDAARAAQIGARVGEWPLFADSADALRRLRGIAPCAATTNSDVAHEEQVRRQLGFALDGWICAEVVRAYKPDPEVWRTAARRMRVPLDRNWWHVSAYADYDHATARALGLTCVLVKRPHHRPGPADLVVNDLTELADLASRM